MRRVEVDDSGDAVTITEFRLYDSETGVCHEVGDRIEGAYGRYVGLRGRITEIHTTLLWVHFDNDLFEAERPPPICFYPGEIRKLTILELLAEQV